MATSSSATIGSPANPNKLLWDKLYQDQKDPWTNKYDQELLKFHDILTNGKGGLDILVPMCGKTRALLALAEKGHHVVGIEWSELAIKQFFGENNLVYSRRSCHIGGIEMSVYIASDKDITIYCGDLFAFKQDNLGGFDCIYDHGSIGSFEAANRAPYAELTNSFTRPGGRILLSFFDYEHSEHPTMPFAVAEKEVITLYSEYFNTIELLQEIDLKAAPKSQQGPNVLFPVWNLSRCSWIVVLIKH